MTKLVLFDLDNTLLNGDSDFEWAQFLIEKGVLEREVYEAKNREFYEQYKAGTLDINAFLDFQLKPLSRHSRIQLEEWRHEFIQQKILPLITASAREIVNSHKNSLTVIITATNTFVTRPIADLLGVTHLIATEPEARDGEFTGRVTGTPCFREGKVTRLNEWLASRETSLKEFESSHFYSDSLNDLPLLSNVTNPVAVDPDPTLRTHAETHAWPIISLR
ncbi:MAG: HAD family hydrolase [Pseudomonadota bacterium]